MYSTVQMQVFTLVWVQVMLLTRETSTVLQVLIATYVYA